MNKDLSEVVRSLNTRTDELELENSELRSPLEERIRIIENLLKD